ncbi:hypothetical protein GQ54DRAFT_310809 [Martensiomyces pterosporus]|nr:hypothetical protein GQ54DRAFT_310809 [Martensiomyces pterosporus]
MTDTSQAFQGENATLINSNRVQQLDSLTRQILNLKVSLALGDLPQLPSPKAIAGVDDSAHSGSENGTADSASSSGSGVRQPVFTEEDFCSKLFAPLGDVPEPDKLKKRLLEDLADPIPIHQHSYDMLKEVDQNVLEKTFCIVEKTGKICPFLTPRVEAALQVTNVGVGTKAMQQHVLDAFLMGIFETAQKYLEAAIQINRNARKAIPELDRRPNFLLMLNGSLVFTGEQNLGGNISKHAGKVKDKVLKTLVGNCEIKYIPCYTTAGSEVLFHCICGSQEIVECSDILNLEELCDRVTMIIILVNIMRVVRSISQ